MIFDEASNTQCTAVIDLAALLHLASASPIRSEPEYCCEIASSSGIVLLHRRCYKHSVTTLHCL